MGAAPRIDTLRRQLTGGRELLDQAGRLLDALHELAYNRQAAGERLQVQESKPLGYSLDGHGDPRARAAYLDLAREVDAACAQIAGACRRVLQVVSAGDELDSDGSDKRTNSSVDALEHAAAIEAQHRRRQRGEFDPGSTVTQPIRQQAQRTATKKIRSLEEQLRTRGRAEQKRQRNLEAKIRRQEKTIKLRDSTIAELQAHLEELQRGDHSDPSDPDGG